MSGLGAIAKRHEVDQFLERFTHSSGYFQLIRRYFGGDAEQMVRLSRWQG